MSEIKIEIIGKKYERLHDIANMPHELNDILTKPKENELSVSGMRFITLLVANLKERQFAKAKKDQLNLFDEEMFSIDNDVNYTIALAFHYSDFLPKGNKNYSQVKKGIEELRDLKYSLKIDLNKNIEGKKPRTITYNSSLILNYIEEEKRGFKILIDKYWYRIFINITEGFNPYLKSIAFNLKSINSLQFYFYLKKLPRIEKTKLINYKGLYENLGDATIEIKGTRPYVQNFIETLNLSYKFESQIIRDYLEPIRAELNKFSDISFNYKFENDKIIIVTYPGNKALISNSISKTETVKIKSAINYKVLKYKLDKRESLLLIELYVKFGYEFVTKATNKNKLLKGLEKAEYFLIFNHLVNEKFKKINIPIEAIGYTNEDQIIIRKELFKKFGNFEENKIELDSLSEKYSRFKK